MTQLIDDIAGKGALVTGASSGLGRAIAVRLAEAGVRVVGLGRSEHALRETGELIEANGGWFSPIIADLANDGTMETSVGEAIEALQELDILINNAGIMNTHRPGITERFRWRTLLQINLLSAIEGCEAAIRHMRAKQVNGRIVNISSLASRLPGGGVYGASKLGLEKYTRELRQALEGESIRVSSIIPGGFSTNLSRGISKEEQSIFQQKFGGKIAEAVADSDGRTPYFGVPDDVARAVLFALAQPDYLNVSELVIRPARSIDPSVFLD